MKFFRDFFAHRVSQPLMGLLREGVTPRKLALAMAFGLTVGMIPSPWGATVICVMIAFLLDINHIAIQVANYLAWPLQLAFLAPFFWLGQKLFPFGDYFSIENLTFASFQQPLDSMQLLLFADAKAIGAWLLLSPLIFTLIYFPALGLFLHLHKNFSQRLYISPDMLDTHRTIEKS
jgi:hypothetical protein